MNRLKACPLATKRKENEIRVIQNILHKNEIQNYDFYGRKNKNETA